MMFALGTALPTGTLSRQASDAFEDDTELGNPFWLGVWGFAAYQPQLSDLVQLWFGARAGFHVMSIDVEAHGRPYDDVELPFFSAGPEVGIMLSQEDGVGVMFWGFADLAIPGSATLTVAFVFEQPKPRGAVW